MKLKKGCMAFFIKCPPAPANIGLPVTLIKRGAGLYRGAWLVEGNIKHDAAAGRRSLPDEVPYLRAWASAEWLSPIDGDSAEPDESTTYLPPVPHKEPA